MKSRNQLMTRLRLACLACVALVALNACAGPTPADYVKEQPKLDLKTYFNGTVDGWGIVQDRSGKVIKRFHVVMKCSWDGNTGTLDEDFGYSDGTKQKRIWTIEKNEDNYVGTAPDVIGKAEGIASGNTLSWVYTLLLPVNDSEYKVKFYECM